MGSDQHNFDELLKKFDDCVNEENERKNEILEIFNQMENEILNKLGVESFDDLDCLKKASNDLNDDDRNYILQLLNLRDKFIIKVLNNEMDQSNIMNKVREKIEESLIEYINNKTKDINNLTEEDKNHINEAIDLIKKGQIDEINFYPKKQEVKEYLDRQD